MARSKKTFTVTYKHGLNLRAEPSKESDVMRVLKFGEKVAKDVDAETVDGWTAVVGGGYVMTEYLK